MIWYNFARKRPLWAHTTVISIINHRQLRGESTRYKKDLLFDEMAMDIDSVFDIDYQKLRLTYILKNGGLADEYITEQGFE